MCIYVPLTALTTLPPSTRYNLYSDVTQSLQEVRESTAESVAKMKEKLANQHGNPTGGVVAMGTDTMVTPLDAGGVMDIQEENAILNKMVYRASHLVIRQCGSTCNC